MPKRKGFLYEWMCDKEHIREAIVFGAKDKHDRRDVRRVLADVDGYTDRVYDLLQTQTFAPAQPKKRISSTTAAESGERSNTFRSSPTALSTR